MLPKPIRLDHDPQLERLAAEMTRRGMRPDRARAEAARTLADRRRLDEKRVIDDLTQDFGPGF